MRVDLYKKVQKLSINSANSKTTGGLINILSNDTSQIQSFVITSITFNKWANYYLSISNYVFS